uniref:DDE_Tnp_1_7 domain-containing protein n=1 Tax=Ascaris lumbricoides TaxID=6252 RepID=A0A0M3ITN1_ASCLU
MSSDEIEDDVEYDERESSVVDEGDALVIESTGEDLIENFDDGDDENEENDMSSDQIEDHESYEEAMMKEKILMKKERKDFKPEDYCVIIKENATKSDRNIIDFNELPFSKMADSVQNAKDAWQWIISPMKLDEFFNDTFERKALVVQRKNPKYYGNLYSTKKFIEILQSHYIEYGTNVNVAVYKDGERFTPNGIGKVYPEEIRAQLNVCFF